MIRLIGAIYFSAASDGIFRRNFLGSESSVGFVIYRVGLKSWSPENGSGRRAATSFPPLMHYPKNSLPSFLSTHKENRTSPRSRNSPSRAWQPVTSPSPTRTKSVSETSPLPFLDQSPLISTPKPC